ncbi:MAG: hypothetical protein AABX50_00715 [Nanoarchaeota archaeon]
MENNLEVTIRGWEVEISLEKSEQFRQNIGRILEKTGFVKGEKYWENVEIGRLRLYSTSRHTGCGIETRHLLMKSPSVIEGVPPIARIIEQAIHDQELISFKIERYSGYA